MCCVLCVYFSFNLIRAFIAIKLNTKGKQRTQPNLCFQVLFPVLFLCVSLLFNGLSERRERGKRERSERQRTKAQKITHQPYQPIPLLFLVLLVLCEESTHYIIFHLSLFTYSTKKNKDRSDRKEQKSTN